MPGTRLLTPFAERPSVYQRTVLVSGVPVVCDSTMRTWKNWPDDVVGRLHDWNGGRKGHTLSFYGEAVWGGYASGWPTLTKKCTECERFFNTMFACWFDQERWVCDDCIISLASEALLLEAAARLFPRNV